MNVQDEIKALKERIAELEVQVEKEQAFPQYGKTYSYINTYGGVESDIWEGHFSERNMVKIGNFFKTEEEAEFAVEKLKVEAELRKFSTNFVLYKENWFLSLADTRKDVMPLYEHRNDTQGVIYFESREEAEEAMDTVSEERIKKYIFGVED